MVSCSKHMMQLCHIHVAVKLLGYMLLHCNGLVLNSINECARTHTAGATLTAKSNRVVSS